MKVELERIRIGVSPITETVYVGTVDRTGVGWLSKVDRTSEFIATLLEWCPSGYCRDVTGSDGRTYLVAVTESL